MVIRAYGDEHLPKMIALHPMMANGESMVRLAGALRERYCIIAPDLSGHGEDGGDFESAEKEADTLYAYLRGRKIVDVAMIYGASLGAAVGLELMAKPELRVRAAVFDGCPLYRNAPVLRLLMTRMFLLKHRKAVRNPGLAAVRMSERYGAQEGQKMGQSFERMSEASIRGIVAACCRCAFHAYPEALEARMFFEYGSADMDLKEGKKNLARYYPKATLTVREGYGHCQYMSGLGEEYGRVLEGYLNR